MVAEEGSSIDWDALTSALEEWDDDTQDTWVTIAEAEAAAGVSRSALRAWYRAEEIPSRVVPGRHGPTRLVPLDAVVARAAESGRTGRRARRADADGGGLGDVVESVVRALTAETVEARAEAAVLAHRVDELEQRVAALEAAAAE